MDASYEIDAATLFPLSDALPNPICKTNALMGVMIEVAGGIDRSSKVGDGPMHFVAVPAKLLEYPREKSMIKVIPS